MKAIILPFEGFHINKHFLFYMEKMYLYIHDTRECI